MEVLHISCEELQGIQELRSLKAGDEQLRFRLSGNKAHSKVKHSKVGGESCGDCQESLEALVSDLRNGSSASSAAAPAAPAAAAPAAADLQENVATS